MQKLDIKVLLIILCIVAIIAAGYFGKLLYEYKTIIGVTKTHVGGTDVFPKFYLNIRNNSLTREIIYLEVLFKVYDWETDKLKGEKKHVLLDHESGGLTIKPGETKTVKTGLFDLRYKKNDVIKYEFVDKKIRKFTEKK